MSRRRDRLVHVTLDEKMQVRRRPEVEHERAVAIYDLLEENIFALKRGEEGPYCLHIRLDDRCLVFDIRAEDDRPITEVPVPLSPFRGLIKDYFILCESYFAAIKTASPSRIEAVDMGRRGLHNEGSELLMERLADRVEVDHDTARRLFTLICILHVRG